MKGYVDVFLLVVPKKNFAAYKRSTRRFAKVAGNLGALECREFVAEDTATPNLQPFPKIMKVKANEVLVHSVIEYRSRKHRDQANEALMADPRMKKMMKEKPLFDMKRMAYGGFETFSSI